MVNKLVLFFANHKNFIKHIVLYTFSDIQNDYNGEDISSQQIMKHHINIDGMT
jgi:hypothetical protein